MNRILIILAVAVAGYLLYKLYFKQLLEQGKSGKMQIGLILMGLVLIVMVAMAKAPAFFALIGAAMTQAMRFAPLMIKYAPWLAKSMGINLPNIGGSTIRTKSLLVSMDSKTGSITGTVLSGEHNGKLLSELEDEQLLQFYAQCRSSDPEAVQLLETYIVRERKHLSGGHQEGSSSSASSPIDHEMSIREACDILGVKSDATKEAVQQAYRLLMKQLHPDRGGSNYLAAKVNAAKDILLKKRQ